MRRNSQAMAALDVPYETLPDWISQRQVVRGKDGKAWLKDLRKVRHKLKGALEKASSGPAPAAKPKQGRCRHHAANPRPDAVPSPKSTILHRDSACKVHA